MTEHISQWIICTRIPITGSNDVSEFGKGMEQMKGLMLSLPATLIPNTINEPVSDWDRQEL